MGIFDFLGGALTGGTDEYNNQITRRDEQARQKQDFGLRERTTAENEKAGKFARDKDGYLIRPDVQGQLADEIGLRNTGLRLANEGQGLTNTGRGVENRVAAGTEAARIASAPLMNRKMQADMEIERQRLGLAGAGLDLQRMNFFNGRSEFDKNATYSTLQALAGQMTTDAMGNKTYTPQARQAQQEMGRLSGLKPVATGFDALFPGSNSGDLGTSRSHPAGMYPKVDSTYDIAMASPKRIK